MTMTTTTCTAAAHRAIGIMLTRANGGVAPAGLAVHVQQPGLPPEPPIRPGDGRDALLFTLQPGGLDVTVCIGTHWTVLRHDGFRAALTPSGLLTLLGRHNGRKVHFWIEDGRLHCDLGSPLLSERQDQEAMRAFNAEFAALVVEAR